LYATDVAFIHIGANDISKDSSCKIICENIQSHVGEIYKAGAKVSLSKSPGKLMSFHKIVTKEFM
jgi:sialic acid synthase SpsE